MIAKSDKISDQAYLRGEQYQDTSNLNARILLHRRFSTNAYGWPRWVFDQIGFSEQSQILEVGCGPGNLWAENANRLSDGWEFMLTDFSPGMVQDARKNLSRGQKRFRFAVADAQAIPFDDAGFDIVIANHMLYHVPDRVKALTEMRRVLKPGGIFYASTIGQTHMQELHDLMRAFDPAVESWGRSHAAPFLLENGSEQLGQWFSLVTVRRYEDALIVTEAEPLVAYVRSMITKPDDFDDGLPAFTDLVRRKLALHGAIHITKDSGIFEAR